ncbi:MAG TPA: hypothetical protein VJY54_06065 [Lachnospiraceae bacterium]|nr:hypothetical protein [Lachnospiraceae bacterium]
MKKFSKLVAVVMVLAMVFSLCGCGNPAKKLYGSWGLNCDFSEMLSKELGEDYADFSCAFPMTILFNFNEDGTFLMSVNKDSFSESLDKWFAEFITYNVDILYAEFEKQGIDKATADEQIQAQFGCSIEEYMTQLIEESVDVDSMADEMTKDGNFVVKGNQLYIAETGEEMDSVTGNPYKITTDTLTIEMSAEEETAEIIPGMEYPLTLSKIQ